MVLDQEKYLAYGPVRMDSFFARTYGVGFAGLAATVVHVVLYHDQEMVERWKSARAANEDIHSRLMRVYPKVPAGLVVCRFVRDHSGSVLGDMYGLELYALVGSPLGPRHCHLCPPCRHCSSSDQPTTRSEHCDRICDRLLASWTRQPHVQDVWLHRQRSRIDVYIRLEARSLHEDPTSSHAHGSAGVYHYFGTCQPRHRHVAREHSTQHLYIPRLGIRSLVVTQTRFTLHRSSGAPLDLHACLATRMEVFTHLFNGVFLVVGALLPIPFCSPPKNSRILLGSSTSIGLSSWPPRRVCRLHCPTFYSNGLFVGFIFAFLLRRYRHHWWARYNYLTLAALDPGVAVCGLIIFFAIQSWEGEMPYWWGNPEDGNYDHCPLGAVNYYGQIL